MKSISRILKGNPTVTESTVYYVLVICCISHFMNDMIQSIIPSIYPILKDKFDFSFAQIGIITLVFQMTSSILLGPLLAALIILPFGQHAISWFAIAAMLAALIMVRLGAWYKARLQYAVKHPRKAEVLNTHISKRAKYGALLILILLIFSKYFYTSCITSYFTFYLIDKFGVSVQASQICLFVFLAAIGTLAGGVFGDRFGRKYVIWFSILGAAPFALAMPYVSLIWTIVFTFLSGLIIASAFSSIVVYATDLMPDKVGLIAGIFFGLMFGLGGIGSAFFGWLADKTSVEYIFKVSAFLPLLGIIAGLLPDTQKKQCF